MSPQIQGDVYVLQNFRSKSPYCRQIYIDIMVDKKPMLGLLDTGSGVTIGDVSVIGNNLERIIPVNKVIIAANGEKLNLLGKVEVQLSMGTIHKKMDILIAD
jgi:hypothetical protein